MNTADITKQLEELRKEWQANPSKRDIIEIQARALKTALEMPRTRSHKRTDEEFTNEVIERLL